MTMLWIVTTALHINVFKLAFRFYFTDQLPLQRTLRNAVSKSYIRMYPFCLCVCFFFSQVFVCRLYFVPTYRGIIYSINHDSIRVNQVQIIYGHINCGTDNSVAAILKAPQFLSKMTPLLEFSLKRISDVWFFVHFQKGSASLRMQEEEKQEH